MAEIELASCCGNGVNLCSRWPGGPARGREKRGGPGVTRFARVAANVAIVDPPAVAGRIREMFEFNVLSLITVTVMETAKTRCRRGQN